VGASYRMREIVEKTGENKSTILHYIRVGLLPEPVRTSKNMAYYPETYVELINIIRTMQSRFFLPLHAIKRILGFIGPNPTVDRAMHMHELLYKMEYAAPDDLDRTYNREELLRETGMKSGELANLEQLQLLVPFEKDMYNTDDLVIAKSLMKVKENNISLQSLDFLPDLVGQLVAKSVDFRDLSIKGLAEEEEWEITRFLSGNLIGFNNYLMRRFLHRELKKKCKAGSVEVDQ